MTTAKRKKPFTMPRHMGPTRSGWEFKPTPEKAPKQPAKKRGR